WFGGFANSNESNSHYRTSSQTSTLVGSSTYTTQQSTPIRDSNINLHQQNIVVSTEAFWQQQQRLHQEHDSRRRTITEPTLSFVSSPLLAAKLKLLSPFYNPKESRLSPKAPSLDNRELAQMRLDHALGVRAHSTHLQQPILGSECLLDRPLKNINLESSNSSRSSLTPLYSGYIWLYIPNIPEANNVRDDSAEEVNGTKGNICISKASGRYVKCFAAINDKGQFQWVEVKKQQASNSDNTMGQDDRASAAAGLYANKTGRRSSSRPSYAIQLTSSPPSTGSASHKLPTVPAVNSSNADNEKAFEVIDGCDDTVVASSHKQYETAESGTTRLVQASMAHKLRLHFFCIKISPASLAEVMSEISAASTTTMTATTMPTETTQPSFKLMTSKEIPLNRTKSTPTTTAATTATKAVPFTVLPPPRTTSLPPSATGRTASIAAVAVTPVLGDPAIVEDQKIEDLTLKPRVRSDTAPATPCVVQGSVDDTTNIPTWPSMSPLHSEKSRNSRMMRLSRTVSANSIISSPQQIIADTQGRTGNNNPNMHSSMISFERERTMSAPPGSYYRASQLCRPSFSSLGRHDSMCSTRSALQTINCVRSSSVLKSSAAVMASHRALTAGRTSTTPATLLNYNNRHGNEAKQRRMMMSGSCSAPSLTSPAGAALILESRDVVSPLPPLLPEIKSNVLTLAADLQKAMLTRKQSISSKCSMSSSSSAASLTAGRRPDLSSPDGGTAVAAEAALRSVGRPMSTQSSSSNGSSKAARPKMTLPETMAYKRASLQQGSAATVPTTVSASQQELSTKSSLGNIGSVVEECEHEEEAENDAEDGKQLEHQKQQQRRQQQQQQRQTLKLMCPFLEQSEGVDAQGRTFVTLKGYTETEDGWKSLQSALERFINGPISDHRSALPPEDTLIPSYNSPPIPEVRQSERAQNFWNAKAKLSEAAFMASMSHNNTSARNATLDTVEKLYGSYEAHELAGVYEISPDLTTLDLSNKQLESSSTPAVVKGLLERIPLPEPRSWHTSVSARQVAAIALALAINTTLTTLVLQDNLVQNNAAQALATSLATNNAVTTLNLAHNLITDVGTHALATMLITNTTLMNLNLTDNMIEDEGIRALAGALGTNTTLKKLELGRNKFEEGGVQALAEALTTNRTLQELDLSDNIIGIYHGFQMVAKALDTNSTLAMLILRNTSVSDNGAQAMARSLAVNTGLSTLNLEENRIEDVGIQALAEVLAINSTLRDLNLSKNPIGFHGVMTLVFEWLCNNSSLTKIHLNDTTLRKGADQELVEAFECGSIRTSLNLHSLTIDKAGAVLLTKCLKKNTLLTILNLEKNDMGWEGTQILSTFLATGSTTLTTLFIGKNNIGNKGTQALAEALKTNRTLSTLDLWSNSIGNIGAQALAETLRINSTLTTLEIRKNFIGDTGTKALAEALKPNNDISDNSDNNTVLTHLDLRNNLLGDDGAEALAEALETNSTLTDLHLDSNRISDKGAFALVKSLSEKNLALVTLTLENNMIGHDGVQDLMDMTKIVYRNLEVSNQQTHSAPLATE
ncbi:hypothetical protein BG004_004712, partial [Podila humilis]